MAPKLWNAATVNLYKGNGEGRDCLFRQGDRCNSPCRLLKENLDWKNFKPVAWNKLYRADIVGQIRYPKGKLHEDEFTTHKFYLAAKTIVYVDISAYNYDRRREGSITLGSACAIWMPARLTMKKPTMSAMRRNWRPSGRRCAIPTAGLCLTVWPNAPTRV